jgi:hypothetical protein
MAALHRERDDLPAANELLQRSEELGEHLGLPQNPYRWRVAMARVLEAEGDLDGAARLLRRDDRRRARDPRAATAPAAREAGAAAGPTAVQRRAPNRLRRRHDARDRRTRPAGSGVALTAPQAGGQAA